MPARSGNNLDWYSTGNLYAAKDGHVYIGCNMDKQARTVFAIIGREDLNTTEGFVTRRERWANHDEVDRIVGEWTQTRTKQEIFDQMIAADVPCGMVMDIEEVLNDEDLNERGVFVEMDQPGLKPMRLPRPPIVFGSQPAPVQPSPFLGEHNVKLYRELLGYDETQLLQLADEEVITRPPGGFSDDS